MQKCPAELLSAILSYAHGDDHVSFSYTTKEYWELVNSRTHLELMKMTLGIPYTFMHAKHYAYCYSRYYFTKHTLRLVHPRMLLTIARRTCKAGRMDLEVIQILAKATREETKIPGDPGYYFGLSTDDVEMMIEEEESLPPLLRSLPIKVSNFVNTNDWVLIDGDFTSITDDDDESDSMHCFDFDPDSSDQKCHQASYYNSDEYFEKMVRPKMFLSSILQEVALRSGHLEYYEKDKNYTDYGAVEGYITLANSKEYILAHKLGITERSIVENTYLSPNCTYQQIREGKEVKQNLYTSDNRLYFAAKKNLYSVVESCDDIFNEDYFKYVSYKSNCTTIAMLLARSRIDCSDTIRINGILLIIYDNAEGLNVMFKYMIARLDYLYLSSNMYMFIKYIVKYDAVRCFELIWSMNVRNYSILRFLLESVMFKYKPYSIMCTINLEKNVLHKICLSLETGLTSLGEWMKS